MNTWLTRCFAGLLLVLPFVPAVADDSDDKEIARLVKQLGSDKFRERDAATKRLRQIGEPAADALVRAMKTNDQEVLRRAEAILIEIGKPAVDALVRAMTTNDLEARRRAEAILTKIGEPALDALQKATTSDNAKVRRRAEKLVAVIEEKVYPELILRGHGSSVWRVCVSADGKRLLTSSGDRTLKLWDAHTGECLQIFKGHTDRALCAALSPNGHRILSGSEDRTVRLWDATTGKELLKMTGHTAKLYRVAFAPEDQALSQGEDNTVRLWDLNTGKSTGVFAGQTEVVRNVAGGDKAKLAATSSRDTSLGLRDLKTGKVVRTIPNLGNEFHNACFSADGKHLLTAAPDDIKGVRILDVETGQELLRINAPNAGGSPFAFSPDGKRIVSGMPLRVWDLATGKELRTYAGHVDGVACVRFFPDGRRIVSTSADGTAHIWRAPR